MGKILLEPRPCMRRVNLYELKAKLVFILHISQEEKRKKLSV